MLAPLRIAATSASAPLMYVARASPVVPASAPLLEVSDSNPNAALHHPSRCCSSVLARRIHGPGAALGCRRIAQRREYSRYDTPAALDLIDQASKRYVCRLLRRGSFADELRKELLACNDLIEKAISGASVAIAAADSFRNEG